MFSDIRYLCGEICDCYILDVLNVWKLEYNSFIILIDIEIEKTFSFLDYA